MRITRAFLAGAALALAATACGGGGDGGGSVCEGSARSFVRNASLAILGRHPLAQGEVEAYVSLYEAAAKAAPDDTKQTTAREVVARAMFASPEYGPRWRRHFMDALNVDRIERASQVSCYGAALREPDHGELAAHVRDTPAIAHRGDGLGAWSMRDLVDSSVALDDVSPLYRAHLMSVMGWPTQAANLAPVQAELARRTELGHRFDAVYLNRDLACLGCHNSEFSVTASDDPATNRFWPLPGMFEQALYGAASGVEPDRAHAIFRVEGVALPLDRAGEGEHPWQWSEGCGGFTPFFLDPDITGVDGQFGRFTGSSSTVYDLEGALMNGVDALAEHGLVVEGEAILDPDEAIAYLTAASIVEAAWKETMGYPLTIANHFPRNQAARDVLKTLTDRFVASHYSVHELLLGIVTTPYFDLAAPSAGCGDAPYTLPPIFDPWVTGDEDVAKRMNGAGDAVFAISPRTLEYAANTALGWPEQPYAAFPDSDCGSTCERADRFCGQGAEVCCDVFATQCGPGQFNPVEYEFIYQQGTGVFLSTHSKGFRGMGLQARLVWEGRYGACAPPPGVTTDFVSELVARGVADGATTQDLVEALNDRFEGAAEIPDDQRADIEAVLGAPLDAIATAAIEPGLRRLCGVVISTPHFQLGGVADAEAHPIPRLTPPDLTLEAVCAEVASRDVPGLTLACDEDALSVTLP